jgi:molecular chaperone DnaK
VPQVEVTFDIDANGILSVSAMDKSSGKTQQIKITAQSGLSEEEIKKAVDDGEKFKREDEEKQQVVAARNGLDNLVYQTEKLLKDNANLPEADKKSAEEAVAEAKKTMENKDAGLSEYKAATDKLQAVSHKITSELYKQAGGPEQGQGAEAGGAAAADGSTEKKSGDDVIDADYKDVN